jgi:hypothetical protein
MLIPVCNGTITNAGANYPRCSTGWVYVDEQIYLGNWLASPTLQEAEDFFGACLGVFALVVVFKLVYDFILNKR